MDQSETMPVVRLKNIGKTFSNGTVALEEFSLAIHDGEFISLLGPSGCGKSTALRLIADLSPPTAGQIDWTAHRAVTRGGIEREIGFVFQEPTLMPWATVYKNVYLPLKLSGVAKADARPHVEEALELVGLGDFHDSYPRELSGGMKMRVSIARALVTKPKLLLMDEPFAALDEITRNKLNNDLQLIWQKYKLTVIFVTHSVFESVYLSSRIVIMAARPGRAIAEINIEAPSPRDLSFRTSEAYGDYCRRASEALLSAMDSRDQM